MVPGRLISPATGEQSQTFEVRPRDAAPCSLWGSPKVRLLDSHGTVMPFRYLQRGMYTSNAPAAPVVVRAQSPTQPRGHQGVFMVAKYRCDVTRDPRHASSARIRLPFVPGSYQVRMPRSRGTGIPLCGKGDPPQLLGTSRIRGSYSQLDPLARPPARPPYAVSMRSPLPSPYGASYGRGDLNGDGRPDLVLVRRNGLVTARISGLGVRRLHLRHNSTLRLQAISTLGQGSRAYALAAVTAHGCSDYWLNSSRTAVIGLRHGRLNLVRIGRRPWSLGFDRGVGDLFQGLRCLPGALVHVTVLLDGRHRLRVDRRQLQLRGLRVREVRRHRATVPGGFRKATRMAGSECPGMSSVGWASVATRFPGWP